MRGGTDDSKPGEADVEAPGAGTMQVTAAGVEVAPGHTCPEAEAPAGSGGDVVTRVAEVEGDRIAKEHDQAAKAFNHAATKLGIDPSSARRVDAHQHPSPDAVHHATAATGSPLISTPLERNPGRSFWIFSPKEPSSTSDAPNIDLSKEPPSQPESSYGGMGVGDPAAQAGGVALGKSAGHTIATTLKEMVGLGGTASTEAPAGAELPDSDVPVGDFATLNERVRAAQAEARRAAGVGGAAGDEQKGAGDEQQTGAGAGQEAAQEQQEGEGLKEKAAAAAETAAGAAYDAAESAAGAASDKVKAARGAASDLAPGVNSPDAAGEARGGGLLGLLGGLVSDIGSKVGITDDAPSTPGDNAGKGRASHESEGAAAADGAQGGQGGGEDRVSNPYLHATRKEGDAFVKNEGAEAGKGGEQDDGVGSTLRRGLEELKVGGAKAPWVDTQGETTAPQDVTSNVERSRHLDDNKERRVYEGETYKVAPKAHAAGDQAATDQDKASRGQGTGASEAVAGDKKPYTGTQPHGRPEHQPKVAAQKTDRFSAGGGGIYGSIGTGSAAPFRGDDSAKRAYAAFQEASAASGGALMGVAVDAQDAPAATQGAPLGGPLSSLARFLRGYGSASAKAPGGKEIKDEQQLLVREEKATGNMHVVGNTIQEGRPAEQVAERGPVGLDNARDKVAQLGKAVADVAKGPPSTDEEAASSSYGKDSSGHQDGAYHAMKRSAQDAAEGLSRAPGKAASAVSTAAEMASGVAEHVAGRTKEVSHNLGVGKDPRARSLEKVEETLQAGASGEATAPSGGPSVYGPGGDIGGETRAKQLEVLASGDKHARDRGTLASKIIEPLSRDSFDEQKAAELARSYKEYKADNAPTPDEKGGADSARANSSAFATDDPVATVRPADRPYDPVGHMQESKQMDASKLPPGPGTNQDTGRLRVDSTGQSGGAASAGSIADSHAHAAAGHQGIHLPTVGGAVDAVKSFFGGAHQHEHPDAARAGDEARENLRGARDAAEEKLHQARGKTGEAFDRADAETGGRLSGAKDAAGDKLQQAKDKAGENFDQADRKVGGKLTEAKDEAGRAADDTKMAAGEARKAAAAALEENKWKEEEGKRGARDAAGAAAEHAKGAAGAAGDAAKEGVHRAGAGIVGALEGVAGAAGHAIGRVLGAAERGADRARADASRAEREGRGAADRTGDAVRGASERAQELGHDLGRRAESVGESARHGAGRAGDAAERAGGKAESAAQRAGEGAEQAKDAAGSALYNVRERASGAVRELEEKFKTAGESLRHGAERAGDEARELGREAKVRAEEAADSARRGAVRAGDDARGAAGRAGEAVRENADKLRETGRQWAGEAEGGAHTLAEKAGAAAGRAEQKLEGAEKRFERSGAAEITGAKGAASATAADFAADAVGETAGPKGAEGERAAEATKRAASHAAEEASRQAQAASAKAGGLLAGLRNTAEAALDALLGPLEREAAFEETAAVHTGPHEPLGVERMTPAEEAALERQRATAEDQARHRAREEVGGVTGHGRGADAPAGDAPVAPRSGNKDVGAKERVQSALEDAAYAAGAAAGHAQKAVESTAQKAQELLARQQEAAKGSATIHLGDREIELQEPFAPAAPPSNTEDILAERARQAAARAQEEAARGPARV